MDPYLCLRMETPHVKRFDMRPRSTDEQSALSELRERATVTRKSARDFMLDPGVYRWSLIRCYPERPGQWDPPHHVVKTYAIRVDSDLTYLPIH